MTKPTTFLKDLPDERRRQLGIALLAVAAIAAFAIIYFQNGESLDWDHTYQKAGRLAFAGPGLYTEDPGYFAPPWVALVLFPVAVLPLQVGRALWFVISLGLFAYTCYKLGGNPLTMVAFIFSPMVANCLIQGNIESLALVGLVLPPQIGLIFLAMKPQTTAAVILFYLVEAWREGGIRLVVRHFWPLALVGAVSCLFYGLWPLRLNQIVNLAGPFNVSIWPRGIPIAIALLIAAFRGRKREFAMMASPFLAPYTVVMSWSGALAAFSTDTLAMILVSLGSWAFWIIYRLSLPF